MDNELREQGINPYSVRGRRMKARRHMEYARSTTGSTRAEEVRLARKHWHDANDLARLYRQYPDLSKMHGVEMEDAA